jgi:hypothetical protein
MDGCFSEFNFRKRNLSLLYSALQNVQWSFLCDSQDVDAAVSSFYSVLNDVFHQYVPLKRSKANSYPAFFDSNIIKTLKLKNAARKIYKSSGSTVDCESFKATRCKLKIDIKTAYSSYVKRMNNDIKTNPRQFWAFINDKKTNFIPSVRSYQSETIIGSQEIVNGFADHFSKFFTPAKKNTHVSPVSNNTFRLHSVTEEQVLIAIKKLKPNMTQGYDQVPAFLVKIKKNRICRKDAR